MEVVHENALAAHPELTELDTYPLSSSFSALIGKLLAVAARYCVCGCTCCCCGVRLCAVDRTDTHQICAWLCTSPSTCLPHITPRYVLVCARLRTRMHECHHTQDCYPVLDELAQGLLSNLQSSVGIKVDPTSDDTRHFTESQALICASLSVPSPPSRLPGLALMWLCAGALPPAAPRGRAEDCRCHH